MNHVTSAVFHQKSANFAILKNIDIVFILVQDFLIF